MSDLGAAWRTTVVAAGASTDAADHVFADLAARHSERGRRYHTLEHVGEVLAALTRLGGGDRAVELAVWLHDVVYDPRRPDNEWASVVWADRTLHMIGVRPYLVREACRLILLTATHEPAPDDAAGCLLCDADLAILASAPGRYERYVSAVRQEYGWLAPDRFRDGRRRVLESFLGRAAIYSTARGRELFEQAARRNVSAELAALSEGA